MTDIKEYIADGVKNIVNGARRGAYGKPENNFHRIALLWQAWLDARGLRIVATNSSDSTYEYRLAAGDVSPMMRLMKEARLCETPDHLDSHMDIVGYALTGAEVAGVQMPPPPLTPNGEMLEAITKKFEAYYDPIIEQKDAQIVALQMKLNMYKGGVIGSPPSSVGQGVALSQAAEKAQVAAGHTSP